MKRVTFYKAVPEIVNTFRDHVIMHDYQKGIRCTNSDDWFHADQVKIKQHELPIVRYCYQDDGVYEEWFTAFDPELQRLIDMQINEKVNHKLSVERRVLDRMYQHEIDKLRSRTVWDIMMTNIKDWWKK